MISKPRKTEENDGIRLDLEQRTFYRFSMLATQINRAVAHAYVQKFGRPAHGWKVVTVLGRFGPLSASQIHAHTTLEMDKVTRIVDSLVEQGLASRQQDPTDRRRVIVSLSAKGKRINTQIEYMIAEMEHEFLIALNKGDRDILYDLLDRLQSRGNEIFVQKQQWGIGR